MHMASPRLAAVGENIINIHTFLHNFTHKRQREFKAVRADSHSAPAPASSSTNRSLPQLGGSL